MRLYRNKTLRRVVLPLLRRLNPGKIAIRHHYTRTRFVLDVFKHKGYWFHGKKRELNTMNLFAKVIKPGDTVIEVGGHIGYISNYFSKLVTGIGKVYVFEPGSNNLPYLKENISTLGNVVLVEKAVSDKNDLADFYMENLSGQNNSLLSAYGTTATVHKYAFAEKNQKIVRVETVTLDSFCKKNKVVPDFIKIDIEGAELMALGGMNWLLEEYAPAMMIEITENRAAIFKILERFGYRYFNDQIQELSRNSMHRSNTFCFHGITHSFMIEDLTGHAAETRK